MAAFVFWDEGYGEWLARVKYAVTNQTEESHVAWVLNIGLTLSCRKIISLLRNVTNLWD
jgi:hypothetical protein